MKKIIKNIIFGACYYSGIMGLTIRTVLQWKRKSLPVLILIYHSILENPDREINKDRTLNHPVYNFVREMKFLKKYFDVVSLDEAVDYIAGNRATKRPVVAITFDDGYENNYRFAFPALKSMNIPATIFLAAGFVDTDKLPLVEKMGQVILTTNKTRLELQSPLCDISCALESFHDKRHAFGKILGRLNDMEYIDRVLLVNEIMSKLGEPKVNGQRMMTWQEVRGMAPHRISFGAHTVTHPDLARIPAEDAKIEILESKRLIEERAGVKVNHFAYPFGFADNFNEDLKESCKTIGFSSVLTAIYGTNKIGSDVYALKRLSPAATVPVFAVTMVRAFLTGGGRYGKSAN